MPNYICSTEYDNKGYRVNYFMCLHCSLNLVADTFFDYNLIVNTKNKKLTYAHGMLSNKCPHKTGMCVYMFTMCE